MIPATEPKPPAPTEPPMVTEPPMAAEPWDGGSPPVTGDGGRRGRFGTAWLTAAVVVGLLLGYVAGLLTPGLIRPGDTSAEAGFARDMSTHHAQAVELSMLAQEHSSNPSVRTLGADIALTQQAQIGMMQSWLRGWGLDPTGTQPRMAWMEDGTDSVRDGLMPGMATDAQRAALRETTDDEFNRRYLELMVNHHLGGIHMADGVLELSDDEDVRWLAQTMVDGQRKEIELIRTLQAQIDG